MLVLGFFNVVQLHARIALDLLQVEGRDFEGLLLFGNQGGQAVGKGVGDAELHI